MAWPQHAIDAVAALNAKIPAAWKVPQELLDRYPIGCDIRPLAATSGILSEAELEITALEQDATTLVAAIKSGERTVEAVITAFSKRAAIAQQAVNCLTDFFFEDALVRARELDRYFREHGKVVGPLHGLPISVKSHYHIKGYIASAGFSNYVVSTETAHALRILESAGAIFYCKTNLPQAIMHLETESFWGLTRNPIKTSLSPGGSSGGCSALMAFGGAIMSMGSDIGGSLRSPAASTGLWTLKPSTLRVPKGDMYAINPGFDTISGSLGPICRSLADVNLFFSVVLSDSKPWLREHSLLPLPWTRDAHRTWRGKGGKLRIGFMEDDGLVRPHPPIVRGLRALKMKLADSGKFEIVDYVPYKHAQAQDLVFELYFTDGGARVRETAAAAGDPLLPLTEWVVTRPTVKDHSMHELWKLHAAREAFKADYYANWTAQALDVLICPAQTQTTAQLGTSKYWNYTSVFNLVDYPAAVFPTGLHVDEKLDISPATADYLSEDDEYVSKLYEPSVYRDTPIGLQAVAGRYEDERLVDALQIIEQFLPLR